MEKSLQLIAISPNELAGIIVQEIKKELQSHSKSEEKQIKYLSRKEVCSKLKISYPTLNEHIKTGKITSYRIGSRVLFKQHEIEQSLIKTNNND